MQNFRALGAPPPDLQNSPPHCEFLATRLDNYRDYSEEQGEKFHQDIRKMKERYQGRCDINILSDYCWCLKRDIPAPKHKRKDLKRPLYLPKPKSQLFFTVIFDCL